MANNVVAISMGQFALAYVLLLVVLLLMKRSRIEQTGLLLMASLRMTLQLVLVGFLLQLIIGDPRPLYTLAFLSAMFGFAIYRTLSTRKDLNRRFQWAVAFSIVFSGLAVVVYFILVVVGESLFNPQYAIPLAGMIVGNAMTGITLGIKTFMESLRDNRLQIRTLTNLGIDCQTILKPFVNNALESALLPTLNSMLGMGIVFLPGMMTGQILSGTMPATAILYQIAIMLAITASVCLTVFLSLNLGYRTLYNDREQFMTREEADRA